MSIPVETLEVIIQANADQFTKEFAKINVQLGGISKASGLMSRNFTGSMFKANVASQILLRTISAVGRGLFNMGKKVVNLGTSYTRLKVATNTVTKNMGLSVTEVNNLRSALEEANTFGSKAEEVIKTLAMSGLVDMSRELKTVDARTGETVKGVKALVLTMKDLGAAAGVDSSIAISRLTKFVRTGNQGFADGILELGNINNLYREYAKGLGKTLQQLKESERATARLQAVQTEGLKTLGAYANTMQTAGKAMASTRDASVSLFERLGNFLEPIFASVARATFLFVDALRSALIGNAETFKQWANRVASYIVAVIRILGMLLTRIPGIGKHFQKLKDFELKPVVNAVDGLNTALGGTSSSLDDATGSAKDLKKELLGLVGFDEMNVLKKPDDKSVGLGAGISVGGFDISDMIKGEELSENVDEINKMADKAEERILRMVETIKQFFKPLVTLWKLNVIPAFDGLVQVWDDFMETLGLGGKEGKSFADIFGIVVTSAITAVIGVLTGIVWVLDLIVKGWKWTWEVAKSVWFLINDWVQKKIMAIVLFFSRKITEMKINWEKFKSMVAKVWEYIKARVIDALERIKMKVRIAILNVKKKFFELKKAMAEVADSIKEKLIGIWDGIQTKIGNVIGWIQKKWQGFTGVVSGIGNAIWTAMKRGLNRAIDYINSFLGGLNRGILRGTGMRIPGIPRLAQGGVVKKDTLAVLHKSSNEAVLPLSGNTAWISDLAEKINTVRSGSSGQPLIIYLGEEKIFDKFINFTKNRALTTNTNILRV